MIRPSFTCKDCPDRYPGCHGKCEKYQKEKSEYERIKTKFSNEYGADYYTKQTIGKRKDAQAKHQKSNRRFKYFNNP